MIQHDTTNWTSINKDDVLINPR